jgi:hypothetical protein
MSPPRPSPPKFSVTCGLASMLRHRQRRALRGDRGEPDDDLVAQVVCDTSPELGALVDHGGSR